MDSRGIIFSIDAALALISLFILLAAVTHFSSTPFVSDHIRINHNAQDTLETMANYKSEDYKSTILQNITDTLKKYNNSPEGVALSGQIADSYLNKALGNSKYTLTEVNYLKGGIIGSNSDMKNAANVAVGVRNYENYTFMLYIWN